MPFNPNYLPILFYIYPDCFHFNFPKDVQFIKNLLTKSGYITETKSNWKLYTNNSYIMPSSSKLKKIKCNLEILVQSYFQTSTEIVMPTFLPMKARVIDQSLNASIVMSYYLLPPGNYHKLADVFYFYIS